MAGMNCLGLISAAICVAMTIGVAAPANGEEPRKPSASHSSSSERSDQDKARSALRQGKVMPLSTILGIVAKKVPGTVISVDLETENNRLIYEIDVLSSSGRKVRLKTDALTGKILDVDNR